MKHLFYLFILSIAACSSIVTNEPFAQNISNQCFEVTESFDIYLREDYASSVYIVGTDENYVRMWRTFNEKKSVAVTLSVGTELKVIRIQDYSHGTMGHCWRVFAKTNKLVGKEFELPTCWSLTSNVWVEPYSPWKLKKNNLNLEMKTKYLTRKNNCENS